MSHKYCAVIIEPRRHRALEFVLRNARECLSADWKIILFHGSNNGAYAQEIVDRIDSPIQLVNLNVDNLNQITYSRLLATKSAVYDHIDRDMFLVFQTDSMIFKQHAHFMEDFLQYDYVGSPWLVTAYQPTKRCDFIGNGGFSLRRKSTMTNMRICTFRRDTMLCRYISHPTRSRDAFRLTRPLPRSQWPVISRGQHPIGQNLRSSILNALSCTHYKVPPKDIHVVLCRYHADYIWKGEHVDGCNRTL
jgi:Protein of unknown function (DUF5672)